MMNWLYRSYDCWNDRSESDGTDDILSCLLLYSNFIDKDVLSYQYVVNPRTLHYFGFRFISISTSTFSGLLVVFCTGLRICKTLLSTLHQSPDYLLSSLSKTIGNSHNISHYICRNFLSHADKAVTNKMHNFILGSTHELTTWEALSWKLGFDHRWQLWVNSTNLFCSIPIFLDLSIRISFIFVFQALPFTSPNFIHNLVLFA